MAEPDRLVPDSPKVNLRPADFLSLLIFGGMLLQMGRLAAGCWSLARIQSRAVSFSLPPGVVERAMGLAKPPSFWISPDVRAPFLAGWRHPRLILPGDAPSWSEAKLAMVLAHEGAHISRRDLLFQPVLLIAGILYWWHPFTWLALRRVRREQEQACDDRVLAESIRPSDYASVLAEAARLAGVGSGLPPSAIAMASHSTIGRRIRHILEPNVRRHPAGRQIRLLGSCALLAGLAALSVVRLTAGVVPSATKAAAPQAVREFETSNVTVICEVIRLPQSYARVLQPLGGTPAVFQEARAFVAKGDGRIECVLAVATKSGVRAQAEGEGATFEVEPIAGQTLDIDAKFSRENQSVTTRSHAGGAYLPLGAEDVLLLGTLQSVPDHVDFVFVYRRDLP